MHLYVLQMELVCDVPESHATTAVSLILLEGGQIFLRDALAQLRKRVLCSAESVGDG